MNQEQENTKYKLIAILSELIYQIRKDKYTIDDLICLDNVLTEFNSNLIT